MNWLIDEYFKRDLTEAEEKALADLLASSPEEAELFAQKMGAFYGGLGLSAPEWPGGAVPIARKAFPWKALGLGLALVTGIGLGWVWTHRPEAPASGIAPTETRSSVPLEAQKVPAKVAREKKDEPLPEASRPAPLPKSQGPAAKIEQAPSADPGLPTLDPPRQAPALSAPPPGLPLAERLTVTVNRARSGLATVKVVDAEGYQVRSLYAGILPAGKRSFTWDGRTDDGSLAAPGRYWLEVRSGAEVFRRELDLGAAE
jgi:hypothetical protein